MVKRRVCETCLYFEPAGFSRNGWCHHPSRRQNSDVRLMVRANELGCRNGWNADLWVPAENDGSTRREHPLDPIGNRAKSEVGPAEQNDLITSIVAARTENAPIASSRPEPPESPQVRLEEDIFVKQTPSLTWKRDPVSEQRASELVQDPKAAILRARDQFRQRRKTEGRLADREIAPPLAPQFASAREARMLDELDLVEPEPAAESVDPKYENRPLLRQPASEPFHDRRPVAPVSLREIDRPFPSMTDFPEDRSRFESVPSFEDQADEPIVTEMVLDDTWIETRQLDTVPPEPYVVDDSFEEDEVVSFDEAELPAQEEELEFSVHHRESMLNRLLRQRRERRQATIAASEPIHETIPDAELRANVHRPTQQPVEAQYPVPPRGYESPRLLEPREEIAIPEVSSALRYQEFEIATRPSSSRPVSSMRAWPAPPARRDVAPELDDDFMLPPPLPAFEPNHRPEPVSAVRARSRQEQPRPAAPLPARRSMVEAPVADEFGDRPLFAAAPAPADADIEQSSSARSLNPPPAYRMERICRTCRDFRPSENGDRGWCNNKWAFSHRRMVDADDLACRNSLGSWWTPKDDVWRRDGDISRHAQQTPRVDEWLFGTHTESTDRRRSGS